VEHKFETWNQSKLAAEKWSDTTLLSSASSSSWYSPGGRRGRLQVEFDDVVDGFTQKTLNF